MAQDTPVPVPAATAATAPLAQPPTLSPPHASTETSVNAPPAAASATFPAGADGGGAVESTDPSFVQSLLGQVRAGCSSAVIAGRLRAGGEGVLTIMHAVVRAGLMEGIILLKQETNLADFDLSRRRSRNCIIVPSPAMFLAKSKLNYVCRVDVYHKKESLVFIARSTLRVLTLFSTPYLPNFPLR